MPFAFLETLNTRDAAKHFFIEHFSGAVDIVGEERLLDEFEQNPRGNLVTINVRSPAFLSHLTHGHRCRPRTGHHMPLY